MRTFPEWCATSTWLLAEIRFIWWSPFLFTSTTYMLWLSGLSFFMVWMLSTSGRLCWAIKIAGLSRSHPIYLRPLSRKSTKPPPSVSGLPPPAAPLLKTARLLRSNDSFASTWRAGEERMQQWESRRECLNESAKPFKATHHRINSYRETHHQTRSGLIRVLPIWSLRKSQMLLHTLL